MSIEYILHPVYNKPIKSIKPQTQSTLIIEQTLHFDYDILYLLSEISNHNKGGDKMTDNELLLAISNMLDPIRNDMQSIKQDIQEIKTRVKKIEITQENEILPRLNTIESCYTSTYDRYKNQVETYESMKQDISIIKKVVAEHSEKLQKLA